MSNRNRVEVFYLDNGMAVYNRPGHTNISGVGIKAGSLHDPQGKSGLAHFTEHVISRVSKRHPDPREIEFLFDAHMGDGELDIRTTRTNTFYGHTSLLRKRHMLEIFDVMASFVHPSSRIVDQEGIDVEAGSVHQEYHLHGIDHMPDLLDDLLRKAMYRRNPARQRIDCEIDDLRSFTLADVQRFLRRYYVPKNAFVILFGPKPDEAKGIAARYFADWKVATKPTLDYDHSDNFPQFSATRSHEIERNIHQYHCAIGFPTEKYCMGSEEPEVIDVLSRILQRRLFQKLREENRIFNGGVYGAPVYTERSHVHGMIYAAFATTGKDFAAEAEEIVVREFRRFMVELVSQDEFDAQVSALHNQHCDAAWSNFNKLKEMVIEAISNGDDGLDHFHAYRRRLARVTRRKLRTVANKYFANGYARALIRPA